MPTFKDLVAQRDLLNKQIEQLRESERAEAVASAKGLIAEFGLTQQEIFGGASGKGTRRSTGPVAAK